MPHTHHQLRKRRIKGMGWRPDTPDYRDIKLHRVVKLPAYGPDCDLRANPWYPAAYEQAQMGSCTGNAAGGICQYVRGKLGLPPLGPAGTPSRLAIYYGERQIEGTVGFDAGAELRDAMRVLNQQGIADESLWPYLDANLTVQPPPAYYTEAAKHTITQYMAVDQSQDGICGALAAGYPIAFGFSVYDSFMSSTVEASGIVPMPGPNEQLLGGHAVVIVGYNLAGMTVTVRNSWGIGWGQQGHCIMPMAYVLNPDLASDFWVCQLEAA